MSDTTQTNVSPQSGTNDPQGIVGQTFKLPNEPLPAAPADETNPLETLTKAAAHAIETATVAHGNASAAHDKANQALAAITDIAQTVSTVAETATAGSGLIAALIDDVEALFGHLGLGPSKSKSTQTADASVADAVQKTP